MHGVPENRDLEREQLRHLQSGEFTLPRQEEADLRSVPFELPAKPDVVVAWFLKDAPVAQEQTSKETRSWNPSIQGPARK
jgi:hypothetical protein